MKSKYRNRSELYIPFYFGLFQLFEKPGHIALYIYLLSYVNRDPTNTMKGWSFPPWTMLKKEINMDARTARKYAKELKAHKYKIITNMQTFTDRNGHRRWKFKLKSPDELLEIVTSSAFNNHKAKQEAERNIERRKDEFYENYGDSDYHEYKIDDSNNAVE